MSKSATIVGVEEGYRLWSETYDDAPNPLLALEERLLRPLVTEVRGKRVLDLGCGTGRWLARLLEQGAASVVGVDLSPEMLVRAQRKPQLAGTLVRGRCDRLPVKSAFADVILCSFTLGYMLDLDAFTREVGRVAAPNASVLISDFHPEAHARGWRRSFRCGGEEIEVRNFVHTLAEIEKAFESVGFNICQLMERSFGEAERAAFRAAGKDESFARAVEAGPAIFICRLRRVHHAMPLRQPSQQRTLVLAGARIAMDARTAVTGDVEINGGCVQHIGSSARVACSIDLSGYMVLPGLINAHDHLEFNLFPRLGQGPYHNFQQWAEAIYRPAESPVREHCAIPRSARLWWGGLKNIFSGVTTVCHHNPYDAEVFSDFALRVVRRYGWAHSIPLGEDIRAAYRGTPADAPFVIHLSEGTDAESELEIFELARLGALGRNTVVVHGVGLSQGGRRLLRTCGASLVWCPSSNLFTLGRTLSMEELEACDRIALGTDSALSGAGGLLDELKIARGLGVSAERLYDMVTTSAADVLRLRDGEGVVRPGAVGDMVVVPDWKLTPAETLCGLQERDIEAVIVGGRPRLISAELASRWPARLPDMQEIAVAGVRRQADAPVQQLMQSASQCIGTHLRLAGKPVSL